MEGHLGNIIGPEGIINEDYCNKGETQLESNTIFTEYNSKRHYLTMYRRHYGKRNKKPSMCVFRLIAKQNIFTKWPTIQWLAINFSFTLSHTLEWKPLFERLYKGSWVAYVVFYTQSIIHSLRPWEKICSCFTWNFVETFKTLHHLCKVTTDWLKWITCSIISLKSA